MADLCYKAYHETLFFSMTHSIMALIKQFWLLMTLRVGPQDLPYSHGLLSLLLFINYGLEAFRLNGHYPLNEVIWWVPTIMAIMIVYTWLLLTLKSLRVRLLQTLLAIFVMDTIISVFGLPLILFESWFYKASYSQEWLQVSASVYLLVAFLLTVWVLILLGHIYRHALKVSYLSGLVVGFALFGLNMTAYSYLMKPYLGN